MMKKMVYLLCLGMIFLALGCNELKTESLEINGSQPVKLTVVSNLDELSSQEAVIREDGTTLRFGISRDQAALGGLITVYCLSSQPLELSGISHARYELGPFAVEAVHPHSKSQEDEKRYLQEILSRKLAGPVLYVLALPIDFNSDGDAEYQIKDGGETVASFSVNYHQEQGNLPHWLALFTDEAQKDQLVSAEADQAGLVFASPMIVNLHSPMRPYWNSQYPIAVNRLSGEILPRLESSDHWAEARLKVNEKTMMFEVEMDQAIELSSPEMHWVARFWINDQPVRATRIRVEAELSKEALSISGKRLNLPIHELAESLGAKSGDQITCQLAYGMNGWVLDTPLEMEERLFYEYFSKEKVTPLIKTNRVTFTVKDE